MITSGDKEGEGGDKAGEYYDLAATSAQPAWVAHPAVGEASFDAFVQRPDNPLHTGATLAPTLTLTLTLNPNLNPNPNPNPKP